MTIQNDFPEIVYENLTNMETPIFATFETMHLDTRATFLNSLKIATFLSLSYTTYAKTEAKAEKTSHLKGIKGKVQVKN